MKEGDAYRLRWFAPGGKVDLCGHATLATAWTLLRFYEPEATEVRFNTLSGRLTVTRDGKRLSMDFPAYALRQVPVTAAMEEALGAPVLEAWMGRDFVCVMESAEAVRALAPDLAKIARLDGLLVHPTARGDRGYDCVSRSFGPRCGIPEDPVCGSGHCHVFPYWARVLGKNTLTGWQASKRGGEVRGVLRGDRVTLSGEAALFAESTLSVDA